MGHAIPRQHPAVVLRSHYNLARALLAAATLAVIGLTIAVVILANDGEELTTTAAKPIDAINYGDFNPATGRPHSAPLPQRKLDGTTETADPLVERGRPGVAAPRYDGGPQEGTADIRSSSPRVTEQQTFPGLAEKARDAGQANGNRYDGGPVSRYKGEAEHFTVPPTGSSRAQDGGSPEGTRSGVKDYSKNGATGDYAHGPLPPDTPAKDYSKNTATGD